MTTLKELQALDEKATRLGESPFLDRDDRLRANEAEYEFRQQLATWFRTEGQRVFEDAERYRWLRENAEHSSDDPVYLCSYLHTNEG